MTILAENPLDDGLDAGPVIVGDDLDFRGRHVLHAVARTDGAGRLAVGAAGR
jgi:hypothetical protein